jgi:hypothetical protein
MSNPPKGSSNRQGQNADAAMIGPMRNRVLIVALAAVVARRLRR